MKGTGQAGKGMSLYGVMMVVSIIALIAAAMTGLFMQSLNLTQTFYNGDLAQNEAEAAVAELLARLADNPGFGTAGTEEIRGTMTPGARPNEVYHVLTFRTGTGFPHSTNNTTGGPRAGSLGRNVPGGKIHAVSTGVCRGVTREVEVMIEHPPFPFGLATSGPIRSVDPLVVVGTSSTTAYASGQTDRPGHVVSNSPDGVDIGARPGVSTFVSGFIKSCGAITLAQPAEVRYGLRPFTEATQLPSLDIPALYNNQGGQGVINVVDSTLPAQTLDVMYYCGHDIEYTGPITLQNAFLYVKGNVTVAGGVSGTGAIVVDGNVTFNGGAELNGANRIAVLATGDVTLLGGGNYFQGILYCGGNLNARNVTVVGNNIVNSADPGKGRADLEQCTVVADESAGSLQFTATSSSQAQTQNQTGKVPFSLQVRAYGSFPYPGPTSPNLIQPTDSLSSMENSLRTETQALLNMVNSPNFNQNINFNGNGYSGEVGALLDQFMLLGPIAEEIAALRDQHDALMAVPDDPATPEDESAGAQAQAGVIAEQILLKIEAFMAQEDVAVEAYLDYVRTHAMDNGVYKTGNETIDVSRDYSFDVNTWLPASELHRITYWHVVSGHR